MTSGCWEKEKNPTGKTRNRKIPSAEAKAWFLTVNDSQKPASKHGGKKFEGPHPERHKIRNGRTSHSQKKQYHLENIWASKM